MSEKTLFDEFREDEEFGRLMLQEELIMEVTESFCQILEEENIKKVSLAEKMSKTKSYISQLLNGGKNLTLRSMCNVAYYLGYTVNVQFRKKLKKKVQNSFETEWNLIRRHRPFLDNNNSADDYEIPKCSRFSRMAS